MQELRDADEWQRWANLQVQEELCREMEALKAEENLEVAGRRMRELQARWKQVALAPRAQGEAMWRRFKTAQDEVFARTSAHFAAQNEERAGNLARKQALCERAEALADSTDWVKTATEIQALQAEWKTIGPVARGHEKAIWERFRGACDRFFTRRQEDLKQRKEEWAGNLARKEALCAQAEALAESTEWDSRRRAAQAAAGRVEDDRPGPQVEVRGDLAALPRRVRSVLRSLQASRSGGAAGEGRGSRHGDSRARSAAFRTEASEPVAAPENLYETVQQARAQMAAGAGAAARACSRIWPRAITRRSARIVAAWPAAFAGTDLDPEATRKRMEKLLARVEELVDVAADAEPANLSPAELLAQQWRERLAANTMAGGTCARSRGGALARGRAGSAQRAGAVDAPRTGAGRGGRSAQRAIPARLPRVLRSASTRAS